ncbi:hypothetical protein ILUMI_26774 [Ignelater luminosus]|uniref:Uncharacterized protein n=1 Tax=Ignelater luminosus TaxID=2038154 RepID=A0A8K0C636_IGNLU|nr:hypothetical protein ILUMI_26774 [Ignelater luminosus]
MGAVQQIRVDGAMLPEKMKKGKYKVLFEREKELTLSPLHSHSRRLTSATLLAGDDLTVVQRHGQWKSSIMAQGYIEESASSKVDIARKIFGANSRIETDNILANMNIKNH